MGALERLYAAMEPLRLYALHRNSLVDRELMAYCAGFALLEERMEDIRRMAFIQTARGEELARYEYLVGLVTRPEADDETRRRHVLYRMGAAADDFSREGMVNAIRVLGMEAELVEDIPREALEVRCLEIADPALDLDRLKSGVLAVLPAHLEIVFDIGEMTWDMFDETGIDWDDFDRVRFTWTEFDINGHNLLKGSGD